MSWNSLAGAVAAVVLGTGLALTLATPTFAAAPEPKTLPALRLAPEIPVGSVMLRRAFPDHPRAERADRGEAPRDGQAEAAAACDKTVDLTTTLSGVTAVAALDTVICSNADIDTYERDGRSYVVLAGGDEAAWTHIEVSDPTNPVIVGQFFWTDSPGQTTYTPDLKTFRVGTRDYIAVALERFTLFAFCGVLIIDVSDPTTPLVVSQYIGGTANQNLGPAWCDTHNVFVENDENGDGKYIYATADGPDDMRVLDITSVVDPVEIGRYVAPGAGFDNYVHDITVIDHEGAAGRRVYLAYWDTGLVILNAADVTPGTNPVPIVGPNSIDPAGFLTHHAWASQDGDYVFIQDEFLGAGGDQPVQMWDVSDPAAPIYVDGLELGFDVPVNPAHNLEIRFDLEPSRLYVGWYRQGLQAWDFTSVGFTRSNPEPRTAVAYHQAQTDAGDVNDGTWGVRLADIGGERYVFQSDRTFGLIVNCESCAELVGGAVTGLDLKGAVCRNQTSNQTIPISLAPGATSWDCEAAGLAVSDGDLVLMGMAGLAEAGPDTAGGSVTGLDLKVANCRNQTTDQTVQVSLAPGDRAWDCEAAGLVVDAEDVVSMTVGGFAETVPAPAGSSVSGLDLKKAVCRNQTTGQTVAPSLAPGQTSWDCEAAGLTVGAGDVIVMNMGGFAEAGPEAVGGAVTGIRLGGATCRNQSTGQTVEVTLSPGDSSWDCEAAGLAVSPGEVILMGVGGLA